ncbi:GNAT family N-acetyltransferase [Oceanobacillus salinisoli]|uniref:GNAT family N-acetyltransferase n=1 Tax=Oceanobacillus salinisoli TaxID=2678611 RepID=UPI001E64B167|nr:GNAT family N-acetyltransferase [Oceanobacillus salinisoli]
MKMKEKYIHMSETYVIASETEIVGFISMDDYLAALFIGMNHQGNGYGKKLPEFIKERREHIHLKVYQKNNNTVHFYLRNGFVVKEKLIDEKLQRKSFLWNGKKIKCPIQFDVLGQL